MGQGYSLSTLSAGAAGIDVPELSDLTYEKSLGTARFLKAVRARHQNGLAFIKVVVKSYPEQNFESERKAIASTQSSYLNRCSGLWLTSGGRATEGPSGNPQCLGL